MIKKLPKIDLHCHLDGSIRVDTIIDIAKKENIKLTPLIHGGKSTTIYRSGTPTTQLIASMAKALRLAYQNIDEDIKNVKKLNNQIVIDKSKFIVNKNISCSCTLDGSYQNSRKIWITYKFINEIISFTQQIISPYYRISLCFLPVRFSAGLPRIMHCARPLEISWYRMHRTQQCAD